MNIYISIYLSIYMYICMCVITPYHFLNECPRSSCGRSGMGASRKTNSTQVKSISRSHSPPFTTKIMDNSRMAAFEFLVEDPCPAGLPEVDRSSHEICVGRHKQNIHQSWLRLIVFWKRHRMGSSLLVAVAYGSPLFVATAFPFSQVCRKRDLG